MILVTTVVGISSGAVYGTDLVVGNLKFDRVISPISSDYDFSNISDFDVSKSGEVYVLQSTTRTILCLTDFGLLNCRISLPAEIKGEPRSIVLLPTDQIIVGADGLYLLEYDGTFVRRIDRAELPVYSRGKIAIAPAARPGLPGRGDDEVILYVQQGNQIIATDLEGRIRRVYGAGEIQSLRGATVDRAGRVYALDQGAYKVRVFEADGTPSRSFGRAGGKPGTFGLVNGIGVTSDGAVWVSDVTQAAFHVFDAEGNFQQVLTIPTPSGGMIERGGEVFLASKAIPGIVVLAATRRATGRIN